MKANTQTCWIVLLVTLVTSVTPVQEVVAGDPLDRDITINRVGMRPAMIDIELGQSGALSGQIINEVGRPATGQQVQLILANQDIINVVADNNGRFRVAGVKPGLCQIQYANQTVGCRCWSANTAPPSAKNELLLVAGQSIERGQRPIADLLTGPVLIGMIIGAAIAIPIAIHNSKDDAS